MKFPFSFFCASPFDGIPQTLRLFENFTGWFSGWIGVIQNLELLENFNTFFDSLWAPIVQTLELNENFNSW